MTVTTNFRCPNCGQAVASSQYHPIESCISFKAGIRQGRQEVVEWINGHYGWLSGKWLGKDMKMVLAFEKWEAKLKDMGIFPNIKEGTFEETMRDVPIIELEVSDAREVKG
ncbi:hypothetical protein LCGC14_0369840 [marine sediment metagenome]|uniref:Uncharacterized protein n=1 Tax=marine sediment metagenome TaxID=412755 RepID=A0A0F9T5H1_9ZZZZ